LGGSKKWRMKVRRRRNKRRKMSKIREDERKNNRQ
jgi:hypothetical protein